MSVQKETHLLQFSNNSFIFYFNKICVVPAASTESDSNSGKNDANVEGSGISAHDSSTGKQLTLGGPTENSNDASNDSGAGAKGQPTSSSSSSSGQTPVASNGTSPRGVGPEPHKQPLSFGGNINKNKIVRTSKPWHSDSDQKARDSVVDYIVVRLKAQRPNATEDWVEKLPQMAKRLEYALYHSANSTEEYMDRTTLKSRLQQLALAFPSKGQ